jgi:hypothetical protein
MKPAGKAPPKPYEVVSAQEFPAAPSNARFLELATAVADLADAKAGTTVRLNLATMGAQGPQAQRSAWRMAKARGIPIATRTRAGWIYLQRGQDV